jgi:hypothetical protein
MNALEEKPNETKVAQNRLIVLEIESFQIKVG